MTLTRIEEDLFREICRGNIIFPCHNVTSVKWFAGLNNVSYYKARKACKHLVDLGLIHRTSCMASNEEFVLLNGYGVTAHGTEHPIYVEEDKLEYNRLSGCFAE